MLISVFQYSAATSISTFHSSFGRQITRPTNNSYNNNYIYLWNCLFFCNHQRLQLKIWSWPASVYIQCRVATTSVLLMFNKNNENKSIMTSFCMVLIVYYLACFQRTRWHCRKEEEEGGQYDGPTAWDSLGAGSGWGSRPLRSLGLRPQAIQGGADNQGCGSEFIN